MATIEEISALMDGELVHPEVNNLITALQQDAELRKSWERYSLISDALRNNLPENLGHDVAGSISRALALEPTVLAPRTATFRAKIRELTPVFKQLGGLAVAASVTAITILSLPTKSPNPGIAPQIAAVQTQQIAVAQPVAPSADEYMRVATPGWDLPGQPAAQSRLNNYLTNHNEYALSTDMQGMLPEARLVGYDASQ